MTPRRATMGQSKNKKAAGAPDSTPAATAPPPPGGRGARRTRDICAQAGAFAPTHAVLCPTVDHPKTPFLRPPHALTACPYRDDRVNPAWGGWCYVLTPRTPCCVPQWITLKRPSCTHLTLAAAWVSEHGSRWRSGEYR
jgi:hypothetical protein